MNKKLLEIAAEIVHAQVSAGPMSPDDIQSALVKTFATLQKMQRAEGEGVQLETSEPVEEITAEDRASERMNPKDSIQNEKVVCLECGAEMRQLTARHLSIHSLSPREYKKKWGFPIGQPLSAKVLTKARSKAAKKRGLPENLVKYLARRRQEKLTTPLDEPDVSMVAQEEARESKPATKRGRKRKAE